MAIKELQQYYNQPGSRVDQAVTQARPLPELGIRIQQPHERKDKGAIEYTSIAETVLHWAEDPHGERTFQFISDAYGISRDKLMDIFKRHPGATEYLAAKNEGRFVGMVSTQITKPSLYFMTNALLLAQLHKRGIPVSLMMLEYPTDTFYAMNSDKGGAFGKIDFPVGAHIEHGKMVMDSVQLEVKPMGYKADDGHIVERPNMRIDDANGYRCDQILIKVTSATDPHGNRYPENGGQTASSRETSRALVQAALGVDIGEEYITLTDFYRLLWRKAIDRLRDIGELPSEKEMPMFFVDMQSFYTDIAANAHPSSELTNTLAFDSQEHILRTVLQLDESEVRLGLRSQDSFDNVLAMHNLAMRNGLLVHQNGMMTAGSYYGIQVALPNLYAECSSCGGDKFVGQLKRAQLLRRQYGIPEVEVRIPDQEMPMLEAQIIHLGQFVDRKALEQELNRTLTERANAIQEVNSNFKAKKIDDSTKRRQIDIITQELRAVRAQYAQQLYQQILSEDPSVFTESDFVIPEGFAALMKYYLEGVDSAVIQPQVRAALARIG